MEQTPRFNGKVVKSLGDLNNKMAQLLVVQVIIMFQVQDSCEDNVLAPFQWRFVNKCPSCPQTFIAYGRNSKCDYLTKKTFI